MINQHSSWRLTVTAALVLMAPAVASAQTKTTVRIALSTITTPSAAGCTAKTKLIPITLGAAAKDTVVISVQNDLNVDVNPTDDLTVAIGSGPSQLLAKTATTLTMASSKAGEFVGEALAVTDAGKLLCSIGIPAVDQQPEDPARKAFRFGLGATFDFLSGVHASDVYADVTAFLPDLWAIKGSRWGLDAGLYNGRTTATADTVQNLVRKFVVAHTADTLFTRVTQSYNTAKKVSFEPLGNYASPIVRIMDNLYWSFNFEGVRRTVVTVNTIKVVQADTAAAVTKNPGDTVKDALRFVPGDSVATTRTSGYEEYMGMGPIVVIERGGLEFRTKSIFFGSAKIGSSWKRSYTLQFRLTDQNNGFKIGGEIRSIPDLPTSFLVYLAKDFAFSRLADFLVGGDSGK